MHLNDALAVPFSRLLPEPVVHNLHGPVDRKLERLVVEHAGVTHVTISEWQQAELPLTRTIKIHHGIHVEDYRFKDRKEPSLCFLGRIASMKGVHLAIEVARRAGLPLQIAAEIQPFFQDY